ncbi:isoprenylcysteine carboxylmethyltransferase family protein [Ampullimonas aquatilis]|uniref:isoprenylcysteine carboxylmethyltransferase family protein n=1 Tax=Ampullimonas aquatilis TaxID=1341549 RepID=UPI003C732CD4
MTAYITRPNSATHPLVASSGLLGFVLSFAIVRCLPPFTEVVYNAMFMMLMTAVGVFVPDLLWQKIYLRQSTGMDWQRRDVVASRVGIKYLGLLTTLAMLAFIYWVTPEYRGGFYGRYYLLLAWLVPVWLVLAIPYFRFVDARQINPCDGYWQAGLVVLGRWQEVDGGMLLQHVLGWLIKGFFVPLMFTYFCSDLSSLQVWNLNTLSQGFKYWFDFLYKALFFIDVGWVSMSYLMSFRLTDSQLRSAEPTMSGWVVALLCYQPFWSLIGRQYLDYETGFAWGAWLWSAPLAYGLWGSVILLLVLIYVWATVVFGARFSNLTHRGIITNGPYRFTKHPAYIAKNLSWWLVSVPFVANFRSDEVLRHCLLLLGLNLVYLFRAKTEERHLSRDSVYVDYALWVEQNGWFGWIRKVPLLRYAAYRAPV